MRHSSVRLLGPLVALGLFPVMGLAAPAPVATPSREVFAYNLYREVAKRPGNLALSPWSLKTALTMTWAGAKKGTATEMAKVLGRDRLPNTYRGVNNAFDTALPDLGKGVTLRTANRLYTEKTYTFEASYLETVRKSFGAAPEAADFKGAAEATRQRINAWVEEQTEKRIRGLIPAGGVDALTRLVLVNAIYFLGDWAEPFPARATGPAPFHLSKTKSKDVPMMRRSGSLRFVRSEAAGVRAVELPYKGETLSMVLLVPEAVDGLPALEAQLTSEWVDKLLAGLAPVQVALGLPRFQIDPAESLSLGDTLSGLGMPTAFDKMKADFTGIANPPDPLDRLYISAVFHKAFVKVDEVGTEAAAGSAVSMAVRAAAPARVEKVEADRPFIFLIRDTSGTVLFIGRVSDPIDPGSRG